MSKVGEACGVEDEDGDVGDCVLLLLLFVGTIVEADEDVERW